MVYNESKRIHKSRVNKAKSKVSKKVLADAFHSNFEFADDSLTTTSYNALVKILKAVAQTGALNKVFLRNDERRTQSLTFVDRFARRALTFYRFVSILAKFVRKNLSKQDAVIDGKENL